MDTSWEILSVLGGFLFRVWHEGEKRKEKVKLKTKVSISTPNSVFTPSPFEAACSRNSTPQLQAASSSSSLHVLNHFADGFARPGGATQCWARALRLPQLVCGCLPVRA